MENLCCNFLCIYHSMSNSVHLNPDLWFWSCKVATKAVDALQRNKVWRHIWVGKPKRLMNWRLMKFCWLYAFLVWQLFCARILHAWHSGWKNGYIFFWGATFGAHYRTPSCGPYEAKPCGLGVFSFAEFEHTITCCHRLKPLLTGSTSSFGRQNLCCTKILLQNLLILLLMSMTKKRWIACSWLPLCALSSLQFYDLEWIRQVPTLGRCMIPPPYGLLRVILILPLFPPIHGSCPSSCL